MILYKTKHGAVVSADGQTYLLDRQNKDFDSLLVREGLSLYIEDRLQHAPLCILRGEDILAPIGSQDVWAAGVTYFRSRDARIEESQAAGAADCYDRVYTAERPELFFKAPPRYVAGPNDVIRIRKDATWSVPECSFTAMLRSIHCSPSGVPLVR